jgi:Flp pilus assembly protein TadG
MLLLGIMEFGRVYNAQIELTTAAREGVRVMAMSNNATTARDAAKKAAVSLTPSVVDANITFSSSANSSGTCTTGAQMTVTINYSLSSMTGFAGPFAMKGKSVMLCNG